MPMNRQSVLSTFFGRSLDGIRVEDIRVASNQVGQARPLQESVMMGSVTVLDRRTLSDLPFSQHSPRCRNVYEVMEQPERKTATGNQPARVDRVR